MILFFFKDTATTEIYTLSLHDALPIYWIDSETQALLDRLVESLPTARMLLLVNYRPEYQHGWGSKTYYTQLRLDRKSTRLNSSHANISYAVFCLKKKKIKYLIYHILLL